MRLIHCSLISTDLQLKDLTKAFIAKEKEIKKLNQTLDLWKGLWNQYFYKL